MSAPVYVGVDIGGTNLRAIAVTGDRIGALAGTALDDSNGAAGAIEQTIGLVDDVVRRSRGKLAGIGVAVAGPVDVTTGIVSNPWTLPSLAGVDIREPFVRRFDVPVAVENDADAAGLGEYFHGAGAGADSLAVITLGTGLGVGLVRGGELLRGTAGYHPEAGHHSILETGPACYCGLIGCWETLASGTALERAAHALIQREQWTPEDMITNAAEVAAAADRGDATARKLLSDVGFYVGRGLRNIESFYAPATILIGGGLGRRFDLLELGIARGRTPTSSLSPRATVAAAALGDAAGAVGAACAIRAQLEK